MRKLRLIFSDEAERDIQEILDYHAGILPSLIDMFLTDIDASFKSIKSFPEAWVEVGSKGIRRILLKKFSYAVYYEIKPEGIRILHVFHTSRRPDSWR
jgi:plasmid stabilization system protein ParE